MTEPENPPPDEPSEPEEPPGEELPGGEEPGPEPTPVIDPAQIWASLLEAASTPAEVLAVTVLSSVLDNTQVCTLLLDWDDTGRATGVRWQDVDTALAPDGPLAGRLHCIMAARLRTAAAIATGTPIEMPVTGLDRETVAELVGTGLQAGVSVRFVDPAALG
jgi:hypothetical protein